ncbi:hypothetical protein [Burkholderia cepacia]|uniref:hypothetical protein n=1 Tax=Burkholderia cepacia TaxID=292 RepID=UPI0009C0409E|nr:hypothetical protein [Burkholderia cepacia]
MSEGLGFLNLDAARALAFHEQYSYFNTVVEHNLSGGEKLCSDAKRAFSKANEKLDKYYTKQSVANKCYQVMKRFMLDSGKDMSRCLFIEPSAGSGVFLNAIEESKKGFDIAPTRQSAHNIIKNDFLRGNLLDLLSEKEKRQQLAFIGNPPFGNKSSLAIEFLNRSLGYTNIVGFIVPIQFRKWSVQSRVNKNAILALDIDLEENAFEFLGKDYKLRCCFQVWILDSFAQGVEDLRIQSKPAIKHPDFEMYQFNRTELARKYFDYEWDFAVPRQGFTDYTFKAYSKAECNPKQQWIFFKAKNKKVLARLLKLDFTKLSKKNIGTPGFGKADVIQEYMTKKG